LGREGRSRIDSVTRRMSKAKEVSMSARTSRRELLRGSVAGLMLGAVASEFAIADEPAAAANSRERAKRNFLTHAGDFEDVSRGQPVPHTLKGDALVEAGLTPQSWRLEITGEDKAELKKPMTLENHSAIDYATLVELGKTKAIRYFKALQCNNIAIPLGQGLWEGVPLRNLLELCGPIGNVRRVFYWGFHNNDPKQMFRSSLALNQVLDTPPGEMPPMIAYQLNGEPIPPERGGPVRMIVPWAHGFKSVKWLQKIVLTNRYEANDTYAEQNNDPESYLKTAAYFDSKADETIKIDRVYLSGTAMVGWPGLERVEYWVRATANPVRDLPADDQAWKGAEWQVAEIEPAPGDWRGQLPQGVLPSGVWGFTKDDKPKEWPMRFSLAYWSAKLSGLKPGKYEVRVRTVDKNGFAQPEPRAGQRSGKNLVQCKVLVVE
jgi:DMSO/TMAO reductase YedYZ molybdopterin-dependent catalytic subunit